MIEELRLDRDKTGAAKVIEKDGVFRYLYTNGNIDTSSHVEIRSPHVIVEQELGSKTLENTAVLEQLNV